MRDIEHARAKGCAKEKMHACCMPSRHLIAHLNAIERSVFSFIDSSLIRSYDEHTAFTGRNCGYTIRGYDMVVFDTDLIITYLRRVLRTPTPEFLARKQKALEVINYFTGQRDKGAIIQTTIFNVGDLHVGLTLSCWADLAPEGGAKDIFVHHTAIQVEGDAFRTLNEGDKVEFTIVQGSNREEAKDVKVTQAVPHQKRRRSPNPDQ
jgi:CspA family cold shock protein